MPSPTINQVVQQSRGLLQGALGTEVGILKSEWLPGMSTLDFTEMPRLGVGSTLCAGLTTFTVVAASPSQVTVAPGLDGSVVAEQSAGALVLIRPRFTTWQVFTEVRLTISELSSAVNGLFSHVSEEFPADVVWGTYNLGRVPLRVLRVRYLDPGSTDVWRDVPYVYQPGAATGPQVRTLEIAPPGTVQVQYAAPFDLPETLEDTLLNLSMPDHYAQLLAVGAARNLALTSEARRTQPYSQGDPRRAEEVPVTSSVVVYDRMRARFNELVAQERSRLVSTFPYRFQAPAHT